MHTHLEAVGIHGVPSATSSVEKDADDGKSVVIPGSDCSAKTSVALLKVNKMHLGPKTENKKNLLSAENVILQFYYSTAFRPTYAQIPQS
jgi:hypothetical protein